MYSISDKRKKLFRNLFTANVISGSCGKPKLTDIIQPKPKTFHNDNSSTSSRDKAVVPEDEDRYTSTTTADNIATPSSPHSSSEPETVNPPNASRMVSPCPKISDSVAVVKESDDPYLDFRRSMLQMILERDIYSKDDLRELLNCFLRLNSPSHHDVIVQAFMEIWNGGVMSAPAPSRDSREEEA